MTTEGLVDDLYADHAAALHAYALRLLAGDRFQAEDVVQETFLRAWRHADRLRGTTARAWLFTVARRIVIDRHRRREAEPTERLAAPGGSDDLEDALLSWDVAAAFRTLSAEHRAVLLEVRYRDRTVANTAPSRLWGAELRVLMSGASPGERCRLIARARDGSSDVAATWWTTYSGGGEVTGAAAIAAADLVALDVVTATGRRLVHVPMNQ
jgi:RNA polymerase sigma-70 factor, ECF subfamily